MEKMFETFLAMLMTKVGRKHGRHIDDETNATKERLGDDDV